MPETNNLTYCKLNGLRINTGRGQTSWLSTSLAKQGCQRGGSWGFPLATMNMAPSYVHSKIEEK